MGACEARPHPITTRRRRVSTESNLKDVTSDLAFHSQRSRSLPRANSKRSNRENDRKSFVIKILTSNPLRLKILQAIFAKAAPVKAFQRVGGGGVPLEGADFPKRISPASPHSRKSPNLFSGVIHCRSVRPLRSRNLPDRIEHRTIDPFHDCHRTIAALGSLRFPAANVFHFFSYFPQRADGKL